ncbi:preprotein translocase subunit SecF [Natronospira proteinivora]|uniref:Protein-export membrane protein SecF n=1 Tax=Natronospira proteinivora TaxID=1807133 RepID=A0ABT1G4P4_9GAMM|nr:protein translocase subunit SecF [Natronospira proteinivora]MCP1726266.1 preprotein translocase subunit SecF [Natronospira proteinivora]
MDFIKKTPKIDFVGRRKRIPAMVLSAVLIVLSLGALGVKGLNFGIDFTGGFLVEVGYPEAVEIPVVRETLMEAGFEEATVTTFGTDREILIRLAPDATPGDEEGEGGEEARARVSDMVLEALRAQNPEVDMRRVEFVGPQVGAELVEQGALAVLFALIGILIYVAFRFQYKMAPGAIACLVHDVIIVLGVFAVTQIQFDLSVLAAILAVIGYSLNDTIVLFDRVRENFPKMRKADSIDVINRSVNQMLSRTVVTSGTTLLVLLSLLQFGGEVIFGFALALTVGVIVGTYSSIYVAGTTLILTNLNREDLLPPKKEGEEQENTESVPFQP